MNLVYCFSLVDYQSQAGMFRHYVWDQYIAIYSLDPRVVRWNADVERSLAQEWHLIKSCEEFGRSKFCKFFIKNIKCNNN